MKFGGDRYLTYTGHGGRNSMLYDLKEKRQIPFTGNQAYDGVVLPAGDLYVHPGPFRIYKMSGAIANGASNPPIFSDSEHTDVYESVGETSASGDTRNLRVLTGYSGSTAAVRDYKVVKSGTDYNVTTQGPVTEVCGNLASQGITAEKPILSKDGKMLSVEDYNTRATRILSLQMPGGNCTEIARIEGITDKIQFSPDGKHIAYTRRDENSENETQLLAELDLTTKKSTVLSGPGEDVKYATYKPDGTLLYTRRLPANQRQGNDHDLVLLDKNTVPPTGSSEAKPFDAIGRIWAKACNMDATQMEPGYFAAIGARVNATACNEILTDQNVAATGSTFSKDQLKSACNSSGAPSTLSAPTTTNQ
jgi:hypothetical protein